MTLISYISTALSSILIGFVIGFFVPQVVHPVALIQHKAESVEVRDNMFKKCELIGVVALDKGRQELRHKCDNTVVFLVRKPKTYYTEVGLSYETAK